ncbi:kinase-like protein [Peniophora sp. CONT]|nr:kinase-like protein [Peniophora sp. CONT]
MATSCLRIPQKVNSLLSCSVSSPALFSLPSSALLAVMNVPSRSFDAFETVYYSEDVTIIDPLTFNPVLPFSVDLLRVKGARSPIKPGECTVARVERRNTTETGLIGRTQYSFVLSHSNLARCTFHLASITYASNPTVFVQASVPGVLVNARLLQPGKPYPLRPLDFLELFDTVSNKRWRFQYSSAPLFHDSNNNVSYDIIRQLGQGGQGRVYECSNRGSLERLAVKIVRKAPVKTERPESAAPMDIAREVRMLKKLWEARSVQTYIDTTTLYKHFPQSATTQTPIPIIPFRGSWTALGSDFIALAMAAGDLHRWCTNIAVSTKRPPSEMQACSVAIQVFDALRYIHKEGLVHGDLKPANILVLDSGAYPRVVVSDFGLCMEVKELEEFVHKENRAPGTLMFLPPESATSETRLNPTAGKGNDIWAAGLTLYFMLTVSYFVPQEDVTLPPEQYTVQFFNKLWYALFRRGISQLAINVLERCLKVDPRKRVTANNVLKLTWFKNFQPTGPNTQAQAPLAFSPAGVADMPLADPEASSAVVCLGAKRPHSEPTSDVGEDARKGKAPAQKRRALADWS